jgi:DNA-binding transcriptional LysR family regulator
MKRVSQLWNWLPTFRAAGETQRLSSAGDDLGVSTSAVSRAVRLLEQDLGHPLFERVGRSVRLNDAGQELLNGVRNAMRVIDEAIIAVEGNKFRGTVRIACDEPFASLFVLPVLPSLLKEHPVLVPHISHASTVELSTLLRKGDIDVAVSPLDMGAAGLETHALGSVGLSYYLGPRHPSYRQKSISAAELAGCTKAALASTQKGAWAGFSSQERLGLVAEDVSILISAALEGSYVVLLPDPLAQRYPTLRRVGATPRTVDVFVARRERLGVPTRSDYVIDAMLRHSQRTVGQKPL